MQLKMYAINTGWRLPNYPNDSAEQATISYDVLEGVQNQPVRFNYLSFLFLFFTQ